MTHICVGKLTIIGSDNGLSPGRRQAIIWTNDGILLIGPLGTNFSEILIEIHTFSLKKMHLKMSSAKWRPFGLGLNVLKCTWKIKLINRMHTFLCNKLHLISYTNALNFLHLKHHIDGLVQERLTPLLTHWSTSFLHWPINMTLYQGLMAFTYTLILDGVGVIFS